MKARIIEIEREEIAPGTFRRKFWSSIPFDQLSEEDTQAFFNRTDEIWPQRDSISSLTMRRIQQDMKNGADHFFESISAPPQKVKPDATDFSKN